MAFWLIETEQQLDYLKQFPIKEAFVEVIPYHDHIHPALNDISLVYIRPFNETKGYMLGVSHSETFSLYITTITTILQSIDVIWVRDKKSFLYYFPLKNINDLSILGNVNKPFNTKTHEFFYSKHSNLPQINKIIPVVKHYEKCQHIYNHITKIIPKQLPQYYDFYNNKTILAFFGIEKNGIQIEKRTLDKYYEINNEFYSIQDNRIYTYYKLDTTTRRPSNAFNGINFLAIDKKNGTRRSFISSHELVEFDISAYHPSIIGRLLAYDFGTDDIHQFFANLYQKPIQEAKKITFQQLYGGIFKEYENLEFFQKVKSFIDNNWQEFNTSGKVTVPVSGYCFEKSKLENMNPQKLFNYMLQNIESAINTYILLDIHKLLRRKQSKIILYCYDSFLFEIHTAEQYLKKEIKKIFEKYKLNTKISYGKTYDFTTTL
jgi:hypothetical protein